VHGRWLRQVSVIAAARWRRLGHHPLIPLFPVVARPPRILAVKRAVLRVVCIKVLPVAHSAVASSPPL